MDTSATRKDTIRSPYDGSAVGEMPLAGEAEVEAAIVAVQRGFQVMRRLPRFVRSDILGRAFTALEDWEVSGLMVNDVPIYRIDNMPFGVWKESGLRREGTRFAMREMSEIKHLVINYN
jgi:acyl-CoA reductase-like NAD-dependent aldehyde dehydrogenase